MCATYFVAACGVQGPPRPPRVERPERVTDLVVSQKGRTLEIRFTSPQLAADGERLTRPIEVEILRAVTARGEQPPETAPDNLWITLQPTDLLQHTQSDKIFFPAPLPDQEFDRMQGMMFTFAVRALTRGFRHHPVESDVSNTVRITLLDVSGPVKNLETRATEKAIELSWAPPTSSLSGRNPLAPSGYRVYWSSTGKPGSFQLRGETDSPGYVDPKFLFRRSSFYMVRAEFKDGNQAAESEDSAVAEITPLDTFPPSPPSELTAVYVAGAVELVWKANTEPDLAGYNVMRREAEGSFARLSPELLRTPIYRDSSAQPGRTYYYRVTAVDLANNESPPSDEVAVETR